MNYILDSSNAAVTSVTFMGSTLAGPKGNVNFDGLPLGVVNGEIAVKIMGTGGAGGFSITPPTVTEVRSTAFETSHVLKASAGSLYTLVIFNSKTSSQFILIMNAVSLPGNGAVTLLYPPIPIAAASSLMISLDIPLAASTGIVVANSSTGTFSLTIGSADCAFYAQVA